MFLSLVLYIFNFFDFFFKFKHAYIAFVMGNRFSFVFQFYRKPDVEITTVPGWLFAANYDAVFYFIISCSNVLGQQENEKLDS